MRRLLKHTGVTAIILIITLASLSGQGKGTFEVTRVTGISSGSDEMAPVILSDGILFCSNRKTNPFLTKKNFGGVRLYELYFAPFDTGGEPGKPVRFATNLGSDANIGPASVTADGNTLWFTRNYAPGRKMRKNQPNRLGLFTARRSGSQWTDIQPFEYNNTEYNLSYPYVSDDGRYLFFCSDMPGSLGKYDIYLCESINGKWSAPTNLGNTVNSPDAEIHPFLHSSGRLYFASDCPGGIGGLDIWFSTLAYGSWTKPVALDEPINSEADDFAFYAVRGGLQGYFSSNRQNFNDDIYRFASTIIRRSACDTLQKNSYCYEFIEENALKQDTARTGFRWEWDFGDGTRAVGITAEHCYKGPGVYDVTLDIVNLITGAIEKRQASYELEITDIEQPVITAPDRIRAGEKLVLNAGATYLPGMEIGRYYWNFGDETVATGLEVTKTYPLPGRYNIQLIVSSVPGAGGVVREVCVCKDIEVEANGN
ncbi:MAG: PKD domain-containing protein [Bacteroidales bacterium]